MDSDDGTQATQRFMIAGSAGSGKSTLARILGERTGLPVFHMDHIHWKPGWTERGQSEKTALIAEVVAKQKWILEGNHSRTFDSRIKRAQVLIWLDLPVAVCLFRVARRTLRYRGQTRPDLPPNCPERLDAETLKFLIYVWQSRHKIRKLLRHAYDEPPPHLRVVRLTNSSQIDAFVDELDTANA